MELNSIIHQHYERSGKRKKNLKTAKKIQEYNVGYDIIEVGVSLFAGFTSGSSALIGWGLDSVVEVGYFGVTVPPISVQTVPL
jgi:divalent metal cation (Fe/Co/Zn/Cd) transporter